MTRTSRLRVGIATAAVLSTALISGCGTAEAGAAAVVGDRRITVAQVQSAYDGIVALAGPDAGITQDVILDDLILEPYLTQAASDLGRGVSLHDAELQFQVDASAAKPTPSSLLVMRALAANSQIQGGRTAEQNAATYKEISARLKAAGVHINPRYGSRLDLDPTSATHLQILPATQDWIATPKASATPAPAQGSGTTPEPSTTP